ncbi:MAG: ATP-grasp domain-containing protein [Nitrospinae bacterium]|nr:ATP-grasp domain-containing protein [Nitrospinota bacterium]
MKLFIYEHLSCGGAAGDDLSAGMMAEGRAMLCAAMESFGKVDGIDPFTVNGGEGFCEALERCDAALVIAPETFGTLEKITARVQTAGKINLGCVPQAVRQTGDKLAFARIMDKAGVPHPKTYAVDATFDPEQLFDGRWILKPVDGAGSEGFTIMEGALLEIHPSDGMIAQEFIEGDPMSLSVVSGARWRVILSVNKQKFGADMKYAGGEILDDPPWGECIDIVEKISRAINGLRGYWGVDFIKTPNGPVVMEVNPRLTTSFCGLAGAIRPNPAEFIMAAARGGDIPQVASRRRITFTSNGRIALQ